jgi:hypothetical protein
MHLPRVISALSAYCFRSFFFNIIYNLSVDSPYSIWSVQYVHPPSWARRRRFCRMEAPETKDGTESDRSLVRCATFFLFVFGSSFAYFWSVPVPFPCRCVLYAICVCFPKALGLCCTSCWPEPRVLASAFSRGVKGDRRECCTGGAVLACLGASALGCPSFFFYLCNTRRALRNVDQLR